VAGTSKSRGEPRGSAPEKGTPSWLPLM